MRVHSLSHDLGIGVPAKETEAAKGGPAIPVVGDSAKGKNQPASPPELFEGPKDNSEAIEHVLKGLQPVINGLGLSLKFSQDKETGRRIILVYDLETGEVVRQIPPKEVVAFLRQFKATQGLSAGLIISRRI